MTFSRTEIWAVRSLTTLVAALSISGAYAVLKPNNLETTQKITPIITPISPNPDLILPLNVRFSTKETKAKKIELLREAYPDLTENVFNTLARIVYAEARSDGIEGMTAIATSLKRRFDLDTFFDQNYQGKRVFSNPNEPVTLENIATYEKKEFLNIMF